MTDRRSFFSRLLSSKPNSSPPKPITSGRRPPTTPAPPPTTITSAPTTTKPPPATNASVPTTAPPRPSATTTSDPNTGPAPPATTTASPNTTTQLATTSSTTSTPPPPPQATTSEPPTANPTTPPAATATTTKPPPSNPTTSPPPPSPSSPTTPPPSTTNAIAIESQKVGHSTASTTPDSPYSSATSSPSPSPSPSPSRITTKLSPSSPPESPSPSHAIPPRTRSKPSSPSRVSPQTPSTPQQVQPRSPSRTPKQTSPNSKMKQHASPSKESTQEISAPNNRSPKSHQETKLDSLTMNGTNNPLFESNEKLEGPGDVKEIVEATNSKANGETMKEAQSSSEAKIMEKGESPSVKPTNTTNAYPKKRNTNSNIHNNKSTLPIREHAPLHQDIKEDISTFLNRMSIADPTKAAQDRPVSVITLVGENRGASMQMGSNSSKTEGPIPIHRSYKINSEENVEARTTTDDGEGSSEGKKRMDAEDQPKEAHVNNNAQGINNSIVFNGSIIEGSPGVHMIFNHVPMQSTESTEKPNRIDARKAEFNSTHMDKLTYEPTVRRRCLRGLFLEPSDSDQENSEKPRRHGCRVGCQQSNKGNNVDVL